jgi:hypothetical protein
MRGHQPKRDCAGRFEVEQRCDFCGKPITERTGGHVSDAEVCGETDGPGFYLCGRARCETARDALDAEARLARYAAGRASPRPRKARRRATRRGRDEGR